MLHTMICCGYLGARAVEPVLGILHCEYCGLVLITDVHGMNTKHNIMYGNKWKGTTLKNLKVMWLSFLSSIHICSILNTALKHFLHNAFVLASPDRFLISMLMLSVFSLNAVNPVLYCAAHLHLQRTVVDHRHQALIIIILPLNTHTVVYCSECLYPMSFSNLSSTQSPSQQQCYYCQQGRRGPIGVPCVWDIHYSWIRNYFHTFGWLWSQEMGVNSRAACPFFFFLFASLVWSWLTDVLFLFIALSCFFHMKTFSVCCI